MAVYKVPQDVEAEDKLLGPFSFRQFIYLGIAAAGIAIGFFLYRVLPILVVLPLPIVILFGALALPLRKDQPMETYLLAIARFYLKPKLRVWNPDGTITYVEITAPHVVEDVLTKGFSQETAQERLAYLSQIMDTRGWSVKGVNKAAEERLNQDVVLETASTSDIMDEHTELAKSFDDLMAKKKQSDLDRIRQGLQSGQAPTAPAYVTPTFAQNPYAEISASGIIPPETTMPANAPIQTPAPEPTTEAPLFSPYPSAMRQKVISPSGAQPAVRAPQPVAPAAKRAQPEPPMTSKVSPDIMRLINNPDLNISTIAREAHRLQRGDEGEVVISLHDRS